MLERSQVQRFTWNGPPGGSTSTKPPGPGVLEPGQISLWTSLVPQAEHLRLRAMELLIPPEKERAARFLSDQARWSFVWTRAMLRSLLGTVAGVAPGEIVLGKNPFGKPFIEYPPLANLQFNVSHSREAAVVALAQGCCLGADVEWVARDLDWPSVGAIILAAGEQRRLGLVTKEKQREEFFAYWTCKEAFVKARGMGIDDIPSVEVLLGADGTARYLTLPDGLPPERWRVERFDFAAGYVGAIAYGDR